MTAIKKPNYALWNTLPRDFPKGGTIEDQLKFICIYGHLAPSSHNTQPWKFKVSNNTIEVHADFTYRLPVADPTNKELYISCGCTIPNIEIAAEYFGYSFTTEYFPSPTNDKLIARITFVTDSNRSQLRKDLFPYITKRMTNRAKYKKEKSLAKVFISEVESTLPSGDVDLRLMTSQKDLIKLAAITRKGMFAALSNQKFRDELSTWVRHSWTSKGDGLPANTLGIPDALSIAITALVRSDLMPNNASREEEKMILNSSAIGVLFATSNDIAAWVQAGIFYSLISLIGTKHGIVLSPLSAAIEVSAQRKELTQYLAEARVPMMFFRIGYPTKTFPHSPRRDLCEVLDC